MRKLICAGALWMAAVFGVPAAAQRPADAGDGPRFTTAGELVRPSDYREWVFVSSGIGMTYGPAQAAAGRQPMFDNVFVTRTAYRAFLDTGRWPDKTMFVLEIRRALENVSINNGGRTQGDVAFIEASVKDVERFKATGGWAYFDFGVGPQARPSAAPLAATATCYACHSTNTAADNTFVQFYPELLSAARKHGTLKAGH